MALILEENTYPSGKKYFEFIIRGHVIGYADLTEGGYLISGKRKVLTKKEAAKVMIANHLKRLEKTLAYYRMLFLWLKEDEG